MLACSLPFQAYLALGSFPCSGVGKSCLLLRFADDTRPTGIIVEWAPAKLFVASKSRDRVCARRCYIPVPPDWYIYLHTLHTAS